MKIANDPVFGKAGDAVLVLQPQGGGIKDEERDESVWALDIARELGSLAAISGLARLPRIWSLMTRCAEEHPREPHWYLSLLAVEQARQRDGVGSALMAHVLARVDADHLPAYVENSKARNLEFYERHGFRTFKRLEFAPGGPHLWLMWREAR